MSRQKSLWNLLWGGTKTPNLRRKKNAEKKTKEVTASNTLRGWGGGATPKKTHLKEPSATYFGASSGGQKAVMGTKKKKELIMWLALRF